MRLGGQRTVSGVIDTALDEYIRHERNRRDAEIYQRTPLTPDETAILDIPVQLGLGDEDVDYAELYGFTDARRGDAE